ncbi:MAG: anthranilate synthase component II [Beijerinckiaceae bacterium]
MRVILIDNYDSFTWNLVHLLGGVGCEATVVRNDAMSVSEVMSRAPDALILSPGPCTPKEAGICCELVEKASGSIPIFGVCLGLQTIGHVFGGTVGRAPVPRHGKVSTIHHASKGVFRGLNKSFEATRYHSLVVERADCPDVLEVTAETGDGLIMGLSHKSLPTHGVQFHPESILSENGAVIARTFMDIASEWNNTHRTRH